MQYNTIQSNPIEYNTIIKLNKIKYNTIFLWDPNVYHLGGIYANWCIKT